ncbi:nitroreductase family protein [Falsibacillus albus]|uniref:Nitroreductase n=1 Tax=Falsibacillus albus TaxID=2478915 RepID=A0A3L7JPQ8_9BACI|nr:nitroreductase [Falsibacillus albus]RLQ92314.1 nitroreductase [Falsibacillus albus]
MNILDIIKTRRNIKKFKKDPIDKSKVMEWLDAATWAPNHKMTEPWEILFLGPETREQINHKTNFGDAPVVFVVISKKGKTEVEREENIAATACFVQNYMLAAWAEGIGTFWSSVAISQRNRDILNISDEYDVIGVISSGFPEEIPEPKPRVAITEKVKELN